MTDRMLRIGIACYPTYGGSGIVATELGNALADRGHEVHLLAYADPPRVARGSRMRIHRVEVSAYPLFKFPPYDLALASKMRELIVDAQLDILHVHYAIPHALSAYLARQMAPAAKTKIITTLHGTDITIVGSEPAYQEVTRFGLANSDRVLAVSRWLADETKKRFCTDCEILIAPNFVDTDRFRPAPERRGLPLAVAHASNFRAVKRPQDVVGAFAAIVRRMDARLLLIGDGPELPTCLEQGKQLGVADRIVALGNIDDVETALASADLLLQPSGSEAFGLAPLEAMACGVPVVGYRVGGLPEVVVDGECGALVPFRDCTALAGRAIEILENTPLRESMGAAGRRIAVERFSVSSAVELHERIYRDTLARC